MRMLLQAIGLAGAIALGSASPAPAQINLPLDDIGVDLCPLLDGIQLDILDCAPGGGNDLAVDVCPLLDGIQLDIVDCAPGGGNDLAVDVCPLLDGIQLDIVDCAPGGGGNDLTVDLCPLLDGIQLDILDCAGPGGDPLVDVCPLLDGIQVDLGLCPPGGGGGGVVDLCPLLDGIQLNILQCQDGGNGGIDVCLNIPGVQTNPAACPAGNTDVCPNLPGVQTNPATCAGGGGGGGNGPFGPIGGANIDRTILGAIGVPGGAQVCFFSAVNYEGSSFCVSRGTTLAVLGAWDNTIRSIRIPAGLQIEVCADSALSGQCTTVTTSLPELHGGWDAQISSLRAL